MTKVADFIRKTKHTSCGVVVVAAGSSQRMGQDKLYMELSGEPVLAHTLLSLNACACVREIVLVVRGDDLEHAAELCSRYSIFKVTRVVCGGRNRNESALAGLSELSRDTKLALIHDGARPLVTEEVVTRVLHAAALYSCAAPAVPVTDTIKRVEASVVMETLDRSKLAAMQTPQGFSADIIKAALTRAIELGIEYTDDCAAVEALGMSVHITEGSPENLKITRPADILAAEAILKSRGEVR